MRKSRLIAITLLLAFVGIVVLFRISGSEPLLDGPLDAYIGGQKGSRTLGCLEVNLSEGSEFYLNVAYVTGSDADLSQVEIVDFEFKAEPFITVERQVLALDSGRLAPSFGLVPSALMGVYEFEDLPARLDSERLSKSAISLGLIAKVNVDHEIEAGVDSLPIAALAIGIESIAYKDAEGGLYRADLSRELALVITDSPDSAVDMGVACADVNEDF